MNELVFLDRPTLDANVFTTSTVIAEHAGINRESVNRTIRKQLGRLERFGKVGFKIRASTSGQQQKDYVLNEQQATLLITFLKNTDLVAEFKTALVEQFYAAKQELAHRRVIREIERPRRRTLTDAIQAWPYANKWSYKAITDLLSKAVTGKTTKQIKRERGVSAGTAGADIYTAEEMSRYQTAESQVIALLSLGLPYDQIKAAMSGQGIQITLPAREVSA